MTTPRPTATLRVLLRAALSGGLAMSIAGVLAAPATPTLAAGVDARERGLSSRSESGGRAAIASAPRRLSIDVDGVTRDYSTQALTVAEALAEADIVLDEDDIVSVDLADPVADSMSVTIQRVDVSHVTERVVDAHSTTRIPTTALPAGTEEITTEGVDGVATHAFRVTAVDGVEVAREVLLRAVLTERVDEVVAVGTAGISTPIGSNREIGASLAAARGWTGAQWTCLDSLWQRESGWNHLAQNRSSGAYGIPQALPGSKMATVAADWRTNPATQITWGLGYIAGRYGTPCGAWSHSQTYGWY